MSAGISIDALVVVPLRFRFGFLIFLKYPGSLSIAEVTKRHGRFIHIPDKPTHPPEHQPTLKVYASLIKPKFANTIVWFLCKIAPLEDLRHVKRVRKKIILPDHAFWTGEPQLTVILCLAPDHNDMPPDVQKLVESFYYRNGWLLFLLSHNTFLEDFSRTESKLFAHWSDLSVISNIDGIGDSVRIICKFMRVAIDLAVSGHKPLVNAAVIVDPSVKRIIASETDQVYTHCLLLVT
ncbi:unnamed protein product [Brassica oleracea]